MNKPVDFGTEPWLIEIGDNITLAFGVRFLTHDGASRLFRTKMPDASHQFGNRFGTIKIHENCFIGFNAIIMLNVEIGPNSIVGAGSVVTKDVPPNSVVAGSPARIICTIDEYIQKYQSRIINIQAKTRKELREELTYKLWGEIR